MARLSRKLRVCKWAGTIGCALIVAAFVCSTWWCEQCWSYCDLQWQSREHVHEIWLDGGAIWFRTDTLGVSMFWRIERRPGSQLSTALLPVVRQHGRGVVVVRLPLWLPFLALFIPTLLLRRRDRRRPGLAFCKRCDYDLTGNTSGRCPECGMDVGKKG